MGIKILLCGANRVPFESVEA